MKKLITYLLLVLCFAQTYAQSVSELEKQRKQTLQQLEQTNKMLSQTKKNEKATVNKLNLLSQDIQNRKKLINNINNEISALDNDLTLLSEQKATLELQLLALQNEYANLVRKTHYADINQRPLLFLLSSESFSQAMRRIRYLQEFAQYRKQQALQVKQTQLAIEQQNLLLQQNRKQKENALLTQRKQQENLTRDEKKQKAMLQELKKKEKELIAQQKKQQKKADQLNKKIDDLINKEVKNSATKLTKEQQLIAGGFEKNKGRLPWPTEKGFISGQFGIQPHPTLPKVTVNNRGVYIQTTSGSNARSVYDGEVSAVFVSDGQNVIIIKHGNYRTVYSNLTTLYVKSGDKVQAKQKIGKIYTDSDNDNKTELFFQIRKDTEVLNPSIWLTKQ
ncbi:MAG: peptidoglycan DD-metalloendopeptidase family protein [Paludibacteraceae bacterium]|nr:peptidoglycan DD-metalloendopeptidase family protein [Paludibacteraceae bacterium]